MDGIFDVADLIHQAQLPGFIRQENTGCADLGQGFGGDVAMTGHQIDEPLAQLRRQLLEQPGFLRRIGAEGRAHVLFVAALADIHPDADFFHEAFHLGLQENDAHRAGDGGGMGHDAVGRQGNVVAARGGHTHQDRHQLAAGLFLVGRQFVIEDIAGGDGSAGGVDLENDRADRVILFGQLELGHDIGHHARAVPQQAFGRAFLDGSVGLDDQHLGGLGSLQGVFLVWVGTVGEQADLGGGASLNDKPSHQQKQPCFFHHRYILHPD